MSHFKFSFDSAVKKYWIKTFHPFQVEHSFVLVKNLNKSLF